MMQDMAGCSIPQSLRTSKKQIVLPPSPREKMAYELGFPVGSKRFFDQGMESTSLIILNCIKHWPHQTAGRVGVNGLCCKSSQKGLAFSLEEALTFEED